MTEKTSKLIRLTVIVLGAVILIAGGIFFIVGKSAEKPVAKPVKIIPAVRKKEHKVKTAKPRKKKSDIRDKGGHFDNLPTPEEAKEKFQAALIAYRNASEEEREKVRNMISRLQVGVAGVILTMRTAPQDKIKPEQRPEIHAAGQRLLDIADVVDAELESVNDPDESMVFGSLSGMIRNLGDAAIDIAE